MFNNDDFKEGGVFGKRGITDPAVVEGAFFRYRQGNITQLHAAYQACGSKARMVDEARARRAPGMVMRRFPVPEGDPDITPEMRPDWPILTVPEVSRRYLWPHHHEWMKREVREAHVGRSKHSPEDVERGCTPDELAQIKALLRWPHEWDLTRGADHFGDDVPSHLGSPQHIHVPIAKYLFQASPTEAAQIAPHTHEEDYGVDGFVEPDEHGRLPFEVEMYANHLKWWHRDPDDVPEWDEPHSHSATVKKRDVAMAKRLSSHPMGFARIAGAKRVFFALEGCLKEAALVNAGEATFSCPSVSLWDAPELDAFARNHLRGKTVYVVCDSDWGDSHHEQVTRLTLLARDRLMRNGIEVYACAPPSPDQEKLGVDDFLGRGGKVEDLRVWDLHSDLDLYEEITRRTDRRVQRNGLERDVAVASWIITHADALTGESTVSLGTIARELHAKMGRNKEEDTYQAVQAAVSQIVEDGLLTVVQPLHLRRMYNSLGTQRVWLGKLQVHPELRAKVTNQRLQDQEPRS